MPEQSPRERPSRIPVWRHTTATRSNPRDLNLRDPNASEPTSRAHGLMFPDANAVHFAQSGFYAAREIHIHSAVPLPPHSATQQSNHDEPNSNSSSSASPGLQPTSVPPSILAAQLSHPEHQSVPYSKLLLMLGYGIPFWNSSPTTRNASALFYEEGLLVGDVITLNEEGGYDYLFNIFLPENSERNRFAPEGFKPFNQAIEPSDYDSPGLQHGQYISYSTRLAANDQSPENLYVHHLGHDDNARCDYDEPSECGLRFTSRQPDGALLIVPRGTILQQLDRHIEDAIDPYIRENLQMWYQNTRRVLSEVNPPELGVITGCHKCSCCFMTVFTNADTSQVNITFRSKQSPGLNNTAYKLQSSLASPTNHATNSEHQKKETVFFRGFWISKRTPLQQGIGTTVEVNSGQKIDTSEPIVMPTKEMTSEHLKWRLLPPRQKFPHPSNTIHQYFYNSTNNIDFIMTHDRQWESLLQKSDTEFPNAHDLVERFNAQFQGIQSQSLLTFKHHGAKSEQDSRKEPTKTIGITQILGIENTNGTPQLNKPLGEQHLNKLASMANLASTYHGLGNFESAEKMGEEVLVLSRQVIGEHHPDTLISMHNLASTYHALGKWESAENLEEEVLVLRKKVIGENHPDTLTSMASLASIYCAHGKLESAEKLGEEVLVLLMKVIGEHHPDTLISMANLASTYRAHGKLEIAEKLGEEMLVHQMEVIGEYHPDGPTSMPSFSSRYEELGNFGSAEKLGVLSNKVIGKHDPSDKDKELSDHKLAYPSPWVTQNFPTFEDEHSPSLTSPLQSVKQNDLVNSNGSQTSLGVRRHPALPPSPPSFAHNFGEFPTSLPSPAGQPLGLLQLDSNSSLTVRDAFLSRDLLRSGMPVSATNEISAVPPLQPPPPLPLHHKQQRSKSPGSAGSAKTELGAPYSLGSPPPYYSHVFEQSQGHSEKPTSGSHIASPNTLPSSPAESSQQLSSSFGRPPHSSINSNAAGPSKLFRTASGAPHSLRFTTPTPRWRGYTMDAAKRTFTSSQLQAIVSRAIKQCAEASAIRLLHLETVDNDIPAELHKLELQQTEIKTRYKMMAGRRMDILAALTSHVDGTQQEDPNATLGIINEVRDISVALDRLTQDLHAANEQVSQLTSLRDIHDASALAMATRKLNTSFLNQLAVSDNLQSQVLALEVERDDARKQMAIVANDFDVLHKKVNTEDSVE